MAFTLPTKTKKVELNFCIKKKEMAHKGANFCQVVKIKQEIHEIDDITEGYQK